MNAEKTAIQQYSGSEDLFWHAVVHRDPTFDGLLFYGVRSTRIYCRPTCSSRKPQRHQVCFFDSARSAEMAGYRACKRCHPQQVSALDPAIAKILAVCRYIDDRKHVPTLAELSTYVKMSPTHLQRTFKQLIGVSPFQYSDARRIERFKQQIRQGETITDALYETGYGASSRLYEKARKQLGMSPGTYQRHGQNEEILYTIIQSPLGFLLVAATQRGLCSVRLGNIASTLEQELKQEFKAASLQSADVELQQWTQTFINYLSGSCPLPALPIDVQATAFQLQVWQALQTIPVGTTASYSDVACQIGRPTSVRAVARACATNPVALVIPCHRVVQKDGSLGGYRWGVHLKQELLNLEAHFLTS